MMSRWRDQSDDELVAHAETGQEPFQGIAIEAMRRLRNSIDDLRESTDWYGKWMMALTIVLVFLTIILATLTGLLVYNDLGAGLPPPVVLYR
jgi:hypothetical protein